MKGKDLTERVYKQIKRDLMLGKIPCNELFSEQMLAENYQCSRTPAREAAGQLVAEGFLNKYPSKGYIVRLPSRREMSEMRYSCYVLEKAALEQAGHIAYIEEIRDLYELFEADETDPEKAAFSNLIFHCELSKLSGNQVMVELIEQLHSKMMRNDTQPPENYYDFLGENRTRGQEQPKPAHDSHRRIVDALMERNVPEAIRLLYADFYPSAQKSPSSEENTMEQKCASHIPANS